MINCENISTNFGFRCQRVSENVLFIESPFTLAFDGQLIGAYVQTLPNGRLRLSDNADTIFTALTQGAEPNKKRTQKLIAIAEGFGASVSHAGEIYLECELDNFDYSLARFIEATDRISMGCADMLPQPSSAFEGKLYSILKPIFKTHLKRNFSLIGASGHAVSIPLYVSSNTAPMCISPIGLRADGKINWKSIYHASGKMLDIKNAGHTVKRIVVLEPSSAAEGAQAETALNDSASVLFYTGANALIEQLAA